MDIKNFPDGVAHGTHIDSKREYSPTETLAIGEEGKVASDHPEVVTKIAHAKETKVLDKHV